MALPSVQRTSVKSITTWEGELARAHAPQSVVVSLEDEIDLSRGEMIAAVDAPPRKTTRIEATVVWMHAKPLRVGATYLLKHTSQTVRATFVELRSRIDVEHLAENSAAQLGLNDIGQVVIETSRPLLADRYRESRATGSLILIDPADNGKAGAGMIRVIHEGYEIHRRATTGFLKVGNRPFLAAQIEEGLLAAGAVVLRTRFAEAAQLLNLARLGAFVIVESDEVAPIAFMRSDSANAIFFELAAELESARPEEFLAEIERIASLPRGEDDNDIGLGI
jgi:ribosomal protein L30/L7E